MFIANRVYKLILILLIISSLLGSLTIFIFDFADEMYHFQRAFDISNLQFNLFLPENSYNLGIGFSDHTLANECVANLACLKSPWEFEIGRLSLDEYFFKEYKNGLLGSMLMNAYSGFNYFFQSFGLLIARIFTKNLLLNYFIGRLSFSFIWLILSTFLLLNTLKKHISKEERLSISFIFFIYTFPTVIFNSTSFSGDAGIFAASAIASFSIIKLKNNKKQTRNPKKILKELMLVISLVFSILALISKTVYLPIAFSISVITYLLLRNRLNKIIFSILVSLSFTFHFWWMQYTKSYINEMYKMRRGELSGVSLQSYSEFLDFGQAIFKTILFQSEDLLRQIYGVFGNGPIARLLLPHGYHLFFFVTLSIILICFFYKNIVNIKYLVSPNINHSINMLINKMKDKYFLFGVILISSLIVSFFAIFYAFYIYWARDQILVDIQGRYFLPIIFFIIPSIYFLVDGNSYENKKSYVLKIDKSNSLITKLGNKLRKIEFNKIIILLSASNILIYLVNIFGYYSLRRILDFI